MFNRHKKDQINKDTEAIKEDIQTLAEDSISQVSKDYENIKDEVKTTVNGAIHSVKKEVEYGLSQYNAKAQELADKVHDGLGNEITKYPWVSISIALVIGVMIGGFLKPGRRS